MRRFNQHDPMPIWREPGSKVAAVVKHRSLRPAFAFSASQAAEKISQGAITADQKIFHMIVDLVAAL